MWSETDHILMTGLILALCGAGSWLSAHLLKRHDNVWKAASTDDSSLFAKLCRAASVGSNEGCDDAANSTWAQLPIPLPRPHRDLTISWRIKTIPIAFIGLAWFAFVAIWFMIAGTSADVGPLWHVAFVAMATASALLSLGLIGVMAVKFAPWCGGCAVTHMVNMLLAGAILFWFVHVPTISEPSIAQWSALPVIRALAVTAIILIGLYMYRRARLETRDHLARLQPFKSMVDSLQHDPAFLLREWTAQPKIDIPSREAYVGDESRLVVFTDFQCPGCFCAAREIRDYAEQAFEEGLHVEVRHYPLCTTCNIHVDHNPHTQACDAAYAAEAARVLGGKSAFDRMHDQLFLNRRNLGLTTYLRLAAAIGLDADQFAKTMASAAVRDTVRQDVALADSLGITGTPTMFMDGRLVPAVCRTPRFWMALAADRKRRSQASRDKARKAVA